MIRGVVGGGVVVRRVVGDGVVEGRVVGDGVVGDGVVEGRQAVTSVRSKREEFLDNCFSLLYDAYFNLLRTIRPVPGG